MIRKVDILHESHRCNFACFTGEKSAGLLCIIAYHHKMIVELEENGLNSFAESIVSPYKRRYAKDYNLKIRKLENHATSGDIPVFIHAIYGEILSDFKKSIDEVAHKQLLV